MIIRRADREAYYHYLTVANEGDIRPFVRYQQVVIRMLQLQFVVHKAVMRVREPGRNCDAWCIRF